MPVFQSIVDYCINLENGFNNQDDHLHCSSNKLRAARLASASYLDDKLYSVTEISISHILALSNHRGVILGLTVIILVNGAEFACQNRSTTCQRVIIYTKSSNMRQWVTDQDGLENLRLVDVPEPSQLSNDEALVTINPVSLNYRDTEGKYSSWP